MLTVLSLSQPLTFVCPTLRSCLELGSGIGVGGIAAALLGVPTVVLSDHLAEIVGRLRDNVRSSDRVHC